MNGEKLGQKGMRMEVGGFDIYCEHCWHAYKFDDKQLVIGAYFNGRLNFQCKDCGNKIDLWNATLKSIKKDDRTAIDEICCAIGAVRTILTTDLCANEITEVTFVATGIPENAIILNINYNGLNNGTEAGASVQPVEIYSNPLIRRINSQKASFYGVPHGEPPYPDKANIYIGVTWLPNKANDIGWEYLVNAFLYYIDDRYHGAVLAANASVETLLGKLIQEFLQGKASNENIDQFMKDAATYSHQLNVLLPAFLCGSDIPLLSDQIRGSLNRLRKLRNDLAHGKATTQSVTSDHAAEALCAAVFGNYYINYVGPLLLAAYEE